MTECILFYDIKLKIQFIEDLLSLLIRKRK